MVIDLLIMGITGLVVGFLLGIYVMYVLSKERIEDLICDLERCKKSLDYCRSTHPNNRFVQRREDPEFK